MSTDPTTQRTVSGAEGPPPSVPLGVPKPVARPVAVPAQPPTGPAILGRALLDENGDAWPTRPAGLYGFGLRTREVLLVDPAAWARHERLADAAARWRHICTAISPDIGQGDVDDAEADVWAAVDALGEHPALDGDLADNPTEAGALERFGIDPDELAAVLDGEPTEQPTPSSTDEGGTTPAPPDAGTDTPTTAGEASAQVTPASAGDTGADAEPAPEPAGGAGWDRTAIHKIGANWAMTPELRAQVLALLADRDRRAAEAERAQQRFQHQCELGDENTMHRLRLHAELRAARDDRDRLTRELAETVEANREWATAHAELEAKLAEVREELEYVRADREGLDLQRNRLLAELATARRDAAAAKHRAADGPGWDRVTVEGLIDRSCADATGAELDQLRALLADVDQWEGWVDRLVEHIPEEEGDDVAAEGLVEQWMRKQPAIREEIRRDAAADALDYGARWIRQVFADGIDPEVAKCLDALAVTTRNGTRPVPGSPEPAGGGDDAGQG